MNVECFFLNWNEADTIDLTINHYKQFCGKITVYDNHSDDGSDQIAKMAGCEVIKFGTPGELNDADYRTVKNTCWKNSAADWVIVVDLDEVLSYPNLRAVLQVTKSSGKTIFRTQGYNMVSRKVPACYWEQVQTGIKNDEYSKLVCFNPRAIKEINYEYGCHKASPVGDIQWAQETLSLLHYRCVGGVQRLIDRHALYEKRLSEINRRWKMGNYTYVLDPAMVEEKRAEFEYYLQNSKVLESVFGS